MKQNNNIRLGTITEENWLSAASLSVFEEQKSFVAPAIGILARGYVYRDCNARVWTIEWNGQPAGLALVREFTEEPLGYDLQQLMIDRRFQGQGVGTAALQLILKRLREEAHYGTVEVCVKQDDTAALRLYRNAGFVNSGYVDPDAPDCVNLILSLTETDRAEE